MFILGKGKIVTKELVIKFSVNGYFGDMVLIFRGGF